MSDENHLPIDSSEVATWVPPVNTIEQVLYGGRQHNETPIGMFSSSVPRARNAPPPKKEADTIHHCRRKDGELRTARGDASRRQRGAHYGPIIAALEAHGALTVREIHRELGGRVDAGRISDALGIMAKHGEAQHDGQGTRSRWWLT